MSEYNIDSLQIKALADGWMQLSGTILLENEITVITDSSAPVDVPCIVIGDGESSISKLVRDGKVFSIVGNVPESEEGTIPSIINIINNSISNTASITDTNAEGYIAPTDVVAQDKSVGTSDKYSRADHTHGIASETIDSVLYGGGHSPATLTYKKIMAGNALPNNATGNDGDIFILY